MQRVWIRGTRKGNGEGRGGGEWEVRAVSNEFTHGLFKKKKKNRRVGKIWRLLDDKATWS